MISCATYVIHNTYMSSCATYVIHYRLRIHFVIFIIVCHIIKILINDIGKLIDSKCNCGGFCIHGTHCIGAKDVSLSIKRLKPNTMDDSSEIVSDNIINACNSLSIHLAILFTMMLRYGFSPDGMLFGTMVPIPKGRWANLSNSDNFRAITLSSILCKILDVVILTKESDNLCSSNLQFSFKPGGA